MSSSITVRSRVTKPNSSSQPSDRLSELLEYEWPALPPVKQLKSAIMREKICNGISYIMPLDKARNSINNQFRTDLRAMFQEPYISFSNGHSEKRLHDGSRFHFNTIGCNNGWTAKALPKHVGDYPLNLESERCRQKYARSAPVNKTGSRFYEAEQAEVRAPMFTPVKVVAAPEAIRMRREADELIKSVQDKNQWNCDNNEKSLSTNNTQTHLQSAHTKIRKTSDGKEKSNSGYATNEQQSLKTRNCYSSYAEIRSLKAPPNVIPVSLQSPYLSENDNQNVWRWLHGGHNMTDLEYFLSMCR